MEEKIKIIDKSISEEVRSSFLNYSMSVIVARALPDVRDGLKPVHRRIIFAMNELKMFPNSQYKKSARLVGEVIGKYHPHGDTAVYDTIVRMSQDFNMRYPLVKGHGNFGSIDGDNAAAMRYTEVKMESITTELLSDIEKNTKFIDNYDGNEQEPSILPSKFPNLLVNGSTGIAVGMATSIPPHNLGNVIDAVNLLIENEDIDIESLIDIIQGPDFPTGGIMSSSNRIRESYINGSGNVKLRGKIEIEGENKLVITEIPYQLNKTRLIEKIVEVVNDKKVLGISGLKDESNMKGIRIVIRLKKGFDHEYIINNLYSLTPLQNTFSINYLCLVNNVPKVLNLKEYLKEYLKHQILMLVKKSKFDLEKSKSRIIILEGLLIAITNIDEVIAIIKKSPTPQIAMDRLMNTFNISKRQSQAILDMKLQRLVGLEIEKLKEEISTLRNIINRLEEIIGNRNIQLKIIQNDLNKIKDKFSDKRRTIIEDFETNIDDESLIKEENVVILLSNSDYIKKIPSVDYRKQNVGGVGSSSLKLNDEDILKNIIYGSTHDYYMFFTNTGRVYRLKGYNIPTRSKQSKGLPLINIISNLTKEEKIVRIIKIDPNLLENNDYSLCFITKQGLAKKSLLKEYRLVNKNGKIAISLRENDQIINVLLVNDDSRIVISSSIGRALRFKSSQLRNLGRGSYGVKAMNLINESEIISATTDLFGEYLICLTDKGFGKLINLEETLSIKSRATMGLPLLSLKHSDIGKLKFVKSANLYDELLITTEKGTTIRIKVENISLRKSRTARGIKIMDIKPYDKIKSLTIIQGDNNESEKDHR